MSRPESASDGRPRYDDHRDPQHDEAEDEGPDGKLALVPGVVAVAQRVGVDVGNHHQPTMISVGITTPAIHGSK